MNRTETAVQGLVGRSAAGASPVPLRGVHIDARAQGPCMQVAVRQHYVNREAIPIEAVYVFPLPEGAAVCGFSARVGEQEIEGRVEGREQAFTTYDDALIDGRVAMLLDQERPNVYTVSLGNLAPGANAWIEVRYVQLLVDEGAGYRFLFPTTVSPRFVPPEPAQVGESDAERIDPPRWASVPYGLRFDLHVAAMPLRRVACVSHPIDTTLTEDGAHVTLAQREVALDGDLVLHLEPMKQQAPRAVSVADGDGEVVLMQFRPTALPGGRSAQDITFLLDCSGSMAGSSIIEARRALQLCIRALMPGDRFNVCCFGSTHTFMSPAPWVYDDATLDAATRWLAGIDATLGGTYLLPAITEVLEQTSPAGFERSVVLLTDGQIANEQEVFEVVAAHAPSTRSSAIGIGSGVSEHLVRGIARAGRGGVEFIHPGEAIEPKVLRTFARLTAPRLADMRIDADGAAFELAPRTIPSLVDGEELVLLARFPGKAPARATLQGAAPGGDTHRWAVDVLPSPAATPFASHDAITLCWARHRIREIEEGGGAGSRQARDRRHASDDAALVELGVRYGLTNRAASFVAVGGDAGVDVASMELRRVPIALTRGWGGIAAHAPAAAMSVQLMESVDDMACYDAAEDYDASPPAMSAPAASERWRGGATRRAGLDYLDMPAFLRRSDDDTPPRARNHGDTPLMKALAEQTARGEFRLEALERLLRDLGWHDLPPGFDASKPEHITLLVVVLLESKYVDQASMWQAAVRKGRRWLAEQPYHPDETVADAWVDSH